MGHIGKYMVLVYNIYWYWVPTVYPVNFHLDPIASLLPKVWPGLEQSTFQTPEEELPPRCAIFACSEEIDQ